MEKELFYPQYSSVSSFRILYTPSAFARTSLFHLQEVGSLKTLRAYIQEGRTDFVSVFCCAEWKR